MFQVSVRIVKIIRSYETESPSPDGSGISRLTKTTAKKSCFSKSGIQSTAGIAPVNKNQILKFQIQRVLCLKQNYHFF